MIMSSIAICLGIGLLTVAGHALLYLVSARMVSPGHLWDREGCEGICSVFNFSYRYK